MQSKVSGEGAPRSCSVGGGLTGWVSWEPHAARLSATRKVVRLQPLSVQLGLEDAPLPVNYSIKTESAGIGYALDDLGLTGPIDVVAWSFGGMVALDFALDEPHRIRSLTLIEPPAFWVLHATGPARRRRESPRERARDVAGEHLGVPAGAVPRQLAGFTSVTGVGAPLRQLPQWPAWNRHRQSLRNSGAVVRHYDSAARLDAFDRPVLLVKGTGSSRFLHRIIDALASRLRRAQVIELLAGHGPQIVSIDRFLETLAAFHAAAST